MPDRYHNSIFLRRGRRFDRSSQLYLIFVLAVICSIGLPGAGQAAPPQSGGPPPNVTVATVRTQQVNPAQEYVGRMEAIQAVDLRARVEGFLEKMAFQEGADVKAGDLLYIIEQAPYRARLHQAQAKVTEAESAMTRARQYLQRLQNVKSGGVSATDLDAAVSTEQQAAARLLDARAGLEEAQLNLGYTTIRAPIHGRIGRSAYTKGNLVGPASGALARIVQVDPIRAVYSMSEADYMKMGIVRDAERGDVKNPLVPQLRLPNGQTHPHPGRLDFIDNQVDPGTGTIAVRAVFDNPDGTLLPGQYVGVSVSLSQAKQMPIIPQSAVLEDRQGRYVFVIDDQKTVGMRRIVTSGALENHWVVENGVSAGETIIVQGVQKVTPGQVVQPKMADNPPQAQ